MSGGDEEHKLVVKLRLLGRYDPWVVRNMPTKKSLSFQRENQPTGNEKYTK
jgi:hypothetical protein